MCTINYNNYSCTLYMHIAYHIAYHIITYSSKRRDANKGKSRKEDVFIRL